MKTSFEKLKKTLRYPSLTVLSRSDTAIAQGKTLLQMYYLLMPFMAYIYLWVWNTPMQDNFQPLWPLWWSQLLSIDGNMIGKMVGFGFTATAFLGLLYYKKWYVRAALFLSIWQMHAYESSFIQPSHFWYPCLYISLIFVFIPDSIWKDEADPDTKRKFLLGIWWAQASLMLLYTLAGLWKITAALQQFSEGKVSGFSPYGLAYQLADWLPTQQYNPPLGPFMVNHPLLGWPLYLITMYVQFFALWVMIRPSLQKVWAFELVVFHTGTLVIMGITFGQFVPLILVLFFLSPFSPNRVSLREILTDLPVFGQLFDIFTRIKRALRKQGV